MSSAVYRVVLSAHIQSIDRKKQTTKLIGWSFTVLMDNVSKPSMKAAQELL